MMKHTEIEYRLLHAVRLELEKRMLNEQQSKAGYLSTKFLLEYEDIILWHFGLNDRVKLNDVVDLVLNGWEQDQDSIL
ncbi:hypothetical protein ACFP7A_01135 [Sporolactobacillus kofuensis]|uniref:Uncharacterized protein n=1 Tax=Sporolactobacillus kofuensis TaxID=269672 RepID=A0ABW1WDL3_9BACL|nr:hypothetical protein [Sporolactobacillus kofuensis]MCO7177002.1 hypothetical protein [Sporolactobacillus kofuensis]